jgi:hypothetical protein
MLFLLNVSPSSCLTSSLKLSFHPSFTNVCFGGMKWEEELSEKLWNWEIG